jgi:hypothetical protein
MTSRDSFDPTWWLRKSSDVAPPSPPPPAPPEDPFWEKAQKGKLFRPDEARQEVVANGVECGFKIRRLANLWAKGAGISRTETADTVKYPKDYFDVPKFGYEGNEIEPVRAPDTKTTKHYKAENHPILAWVVSPSGGSAAVVIDSLEKTDSPYGDCKVIQGTPQEVLPLEIRKEMGLP